MVEIEPKKVKRKHSSNRRRMLSPPTLPPRWGEGVAPPPTPQFVTPHVSPEASVDHAHRPRPRRPKRPAHDLHYPTQYPEHIVYEYRFNENQIERWPLEARYYVNSAESSSPPPWGSSGSSPEFSTQVHQQEVGGIMRRRGGRTSPVSVISYNQPQLVRRSALRQPSRRKSTKSVHWVSDFKKKPQDISSDRKMVKVQVQKYIYKISFEKR